jgi:hypothetical protein
MELMAVVHADLSVSMHNSKWMPWMPFPWWTQTDMSSEVRLTPIVAPTCALSIGAACLCLIPCPTSACLTSGLLKAILLSPASSVVVCAPLCSHH